VNERRIVRSAGTHTRSKWKKSGTPTNALSVVRSALEKARRRETVVMSFAVELILVTLSLF